MKIEIIKCLTDNFSYLLINEKNLDTCVVDPGEAKPVLEYIKKNNLNLKYILNTHHHFDHTGGIEDLINFANSISKNSKTQVIIVKTELELIKYFKRNLTSNEIIIGMGAGSISKWMTGLKSSL